MSEWTDGYRRALVDFHLIADSRKLDLSDALIELLADLAGDALVIEREQDNRMRSRRLRAQREALPLFGETIELIEPLTGDTKILDKHTGRIVGTKRSGP